MKFRAKVSGMGDKFIIIIPRAFHKDVKPFKGDYVEVEVRKI
jgi:hypothetical protein